MWIYHIWKGPASLNVVMHPLPIMRLTSSVTTSALPLSPNCFTDDFTTTPITDTSCMDGPMEDVCPWGTLGLLTCCF